MLLRGAHKINQASYFFLLEDLIMLKLSRASFILLATGILSIPSFCFAQADSAAWLDGEVEAGSGWDRARMFDDCNA